MNYPKKKGDVMKSNLNSATINTMLDSYEEKVIVANEKTDIYTNGSSDDWSFNSSRNIQASNSNPSISILLYSSFMRSTRPQMSEIDISRKERVL